MVPKKGKGNGAGGGMTLPQAIAVLTELERRALAFRTIRELLTEAEALMATQTAREARIRELDEAIAERQAALIRAMGGPRRS